MEKRRLRGIFLLSVFLVVCGVFSFARTGEAAPAERVRLSFGGSNTGTWIYMFCATMADTWKRYIPGLEITVLATAGTTANFLPMEKGELDLAGASLSGDYYARNGMYFTKTKLTKFCSLLPATRNAHQAFTYLDSPIKTWKDMEGKRIHVGARASPTSINSEEICKVLGIKPKFIYSSPAEAVDMMKDRRVDGMIYGVGAPWSSLMDIATAQKVKLLPMTPEEQKKVAAALPYFVADLMPAKTYSFQTEDLPGVSSIQTVNARPGLSEAVVYQLAKVAWEHWDEIIKATPAAKWVKPQDIVNMISPIHPGAVKYYREIGIQIPDRLLWKNK